LTPTPSKKIVQVYRRFFDPYIVDLIENQRSLFYNKRSEVVSLQTKNLAIVFWDLTGFSELFNLVKRQYEVTLFLEQYFGLADQLIHQYNGILNKFIGDGILAIFGLGRNKSKSNISGPIEAVSCALEFRRAFEKVKAIWVKLWHLHFGYRSIRINLKCGIDTGDVLFGRLGTDKRDEITVLGSVVNLASRLEYRAKSNQILISEATYKKVKNTFKLEEIRAAGSNRLKGFPNVRVYYNVLN
jgi:adenylate cyclase